MADNLDLSGAKLSSPGQEQPAPAPAPAPASNQPAPKSKPKSEEPQVPSQPQPAKGSSAGMWVFAIIMGLIFGLAGGFIFGTKPDKACFNVNNIVRRLQFAISKPSLAEFSNEQAKVSSYQLEITQDQIKTNYTFTQDKIKITSEDLSNSEIYLDLTQEKAFVLDTNQKVYYLLTLPSDFNKFSKLNPQEFGNFYDTTTKASQQGKLDGKIVWLFETKDKAGGEVKLWVSDCDGLIQKLEQDNQVFSYNYTQINQVSEDQASLPKYAELAPSGEGIEISSSGQQLLSSAQLFLQQLQF